MTTRSRNRTRDVYTLTATSEILKAWEACILIRPDGRFVRARVRLDVETGTADVVFAVLGEHHSWRNRLARWLLGVRIER